MATKKGAKQIEEKESPFHNFEEKPVYEGKLSGYSKSESGMALNFSDGKLVGVSAVIKSLIKSHNETEKLSIGDTMRFELTGKGKTKGGFKINYFRLWINGKEVKQYEASEEEFLSFLTEE